MCLSCAKAAASLLLVLFLVLASFIIGPNTAETTSLSGVKSYAFWHIYGNSQCDYTAIVSEQLAVMRSSGLLNSLERVYYTTIGAARLDLPIDLAKKFVHSGHRDTANETATLGVLYDFCVSHPDSKVLYFHNKGSHRCNDKEVCRGDNPVMVKYLKAMGYECSQILLRRALDCFNLSPHCISALDKHDLCGMRFSLVPALHFPGNYWWANCRHILRLVDPRIQSFNVTFADNSEKLALGLKRKCSRISTGHGRYFAEMYVGSSPNKFAVADCMPPTDGLQYLMGYLLPFRHLQKFCPNMADSWTANSTAASYGEECRTANAWEKPELFKSTVLAAQDKGRCAANMQLLSKRSAIWYGQPYNSMVDWMERYNISRT